jgi:hypothetical protein
MLKLQPPRRAREGDLLWVPVSPDRNAVGLVLFVSRRFRNGMIVGFFRQLFSSPEEVDVGALAEPFVRTPNYTSALLVSKGNWRLIGNSPELLGRCSVPVLRVAASLYYKDEVIGTVKPDQLGDYQEFRLCGYVGLQLTLGELMCPSDGKAG